MREDLAFVVDAQRLANAEVGRGKRVRPGKGAHRQILRCPFADARQVLEPGNRRFDIGAGIEQVRVLRHRARHAEQRARTR